jgi:hypothetical protein
MLPDAEVDKEAGRKKPQKARPEEDPTSIEKVQNVT